MTFKRQFKTTGTSTEAKIVADFSSAVEIQLHELVAKKLVASPEVVFERVFRFAEIYKGERPLFGLSLQETRVSVAAALVQTVISILPKEVKEQVEYAKEFLVKEVSTQTDSKLRITQRTAMS